jgi:hypothetical protein
MGYGKRKLPPDLFNKPKQPEPTDSGHFFGEPNWDVRGDIPSPL